MSVTDPQSAPMQPASPRLLQTILIVAIAGIIGEAAFELYAWLVSPILFDASLQPARLVVAIVEKLTAMTLSYNLAFALHATIGAFGFAAFVYLFRRALPGWVFVAGFLSGLVLWFVAQGMLAPYIGRSFMMGFGPYTQSSFIGHVGMTLIISYVMDALSKRWV